MTTGSDPMRQQRVATIICYTFCQKGHYRKDCPSSTGTSLLPNKNLMYSHPITVTQKYTTSYAVLQSTLVTIMNGLVKAKKTNWQLGKSIQQMQPKQTPSPTQPTITKLTTTP